jgi:adenylosuccinate synthase
LTGLVAHSTPDLVPLPADVPEFLESRLGAPVVLTGHGPDRADRVARVAAAA